MRYLYKESIGENRGRYYTMTNISSSSSINLATSSSRSNSNNNPNISTNGIGSTNSNNSGKRHSLSTIESSVTRLLVSTKHLLESLTQWARQEADDKFVSDAYVKLGNDFRAATRAFTNSGVDISDIGDVPQALRIILEAALSEAPSQENLDRFLPNIRNIIVSLLQNLKAKQLKAKTLSVDRLQRAKAVDDSSQSGSRSASQTYQSPLSKQANSQSQMQSQPQNKNNTRRPPDDYDKNKMLHETNNQEPSHSKSNYTFSIKQPFAEKNEPDTNSSQSKTNSGRFSPMKVKENENNDALSQLQNGNALQRRASKRFSAYQYAKLTNFTSPNNLPRLTSGEISSSSTPNTSFDLKDQPSTPIKPSSTQPEVDESYVFLQISDKTKKVSVRLPVTFASLRLLFVEKFAYSPGMSSFPEIYIKDPQTNVSYELEDSMLETDVKTGCLLCLKEEDSLKLSLKALEDKISQLSTHVEANNSKLATELKDAIKSIELKVPAATPPPQPLPSTSLDNTDSQTDKDPTKKSSKLIKQLKDLSDVQHELLTIKQLQNSNKSNLKSSFDDIMEKVKQIQSTGAQVSESSSRIYMNKSNLKLSEESDNLLTKVDDLQDIMEALRKDVAQRGVRVSDKQLKNTFKEIEFARTLLYNLTEYIKSGKPVWKKIWEAELDKVCEEQQFFNLQDDLTQDLEEDIKKIEETFELIEKCSTEQSKQGAYKRNKVVAKLYIPEPGESLHNLKDAVLNEVAALRPDHSGRLEAIAKAERLREKEKEMMQLTKFQEELGDFVEDSKLKKSGGFEEIERLRQQKDSENLKSSLGIF